MSSLVRSGLERKGRDENYRRANYQAFFLNGCFESSLMDKPCFLPLQNPCEVAIEEKGAGQWMPLVVVTLGQSRGDHYIRMISTSKMP
ncbi:hypothetical protein AVEN_75653-1 [Araneus ventricosus]|uniref:Uncharacterized protein n=1 Tax=Araneus ventricosus TaxID=182803 RepID=A0A4Y2D4N9_ARAVE|nr:hypothetical protein AVEN_75653-1 [Araneus ventricosus]